MAPPLLANIYLHEVLDRWFVEQVQPRLQGQARLIRYADDFVIVFASKRDAERVFDVLPKRFGSYGLTLHPNKTRLVPCGKPSGHSAQRGAKPGTVTFLGFTFYWSHSLRGHWVVKLKTAKDRISRTLRRIREWCSRVRHVPIATQHQALSRKLTGHYAYFGVTTNFASLGQVLDKTTRIWQKALARRSQRGMTWQTMSLLLKRYPLPKPRIVHRYGT